MAHLERVGPDAFEEIHEALLAPLNPALGREDWRRLFEPPWTHDEGWVGLVVRSGGRPAVFAGLLFAEMEVEGRPERFCNLTTWVAAPGHESAAALPILALRELRDHTLTTLTPTAEAARVLRRLGFETLDTHSHLVPPSARLLLPVRPGRARVVLDLEEIAAHLGPGGRAILRDHAGCAEQALLRLDEEVCHVVYTRRTRRKMPAARVAWIDHPALFAREVRTLQRALWRERGLAVIDVDERLLGGHRPAAGRRKPREVPPLFRSSRLRPEQVPELYSELMLFPID